MRSRTVIISLLAGGAIMLPLLASGHGMELMQARLQFDSAGIAHLEMTADYAGNPMINSEDEARTALQDLLRIEVSGHQHKLSDLAPLRLEKRDQFDPASPLPLTDEAAGVKHQLLTAIWQWRPTDNQLRFTVPQGCIHDVLFWKQEPGTKPQWRVLITGDFTPVIAAPRPPISAMMIGLMILGVLVPVAIGRSAFLFRKSTCPLPPSTPSSVSP